MIQNHRIFCVGVLVLCLSCNSTENKPVEKIQYYGTGKISRRHFEVKGKKEGIMKDFFPDGKLKSERFFKNDIQTGKAVFYYPSGKVKESQYYKDGQKHGGDTLWYENGQPEVVLHFQNGKKHGYVRKWAPDGSLIFEAKYEMDTLTEVKGQSVPNPNRTETIDTGTADTSRSSR